MALSHPPDRLDLGAPSSLIEPHTANTVLPERTRTQRTVPLSG